MNSTNTFTYGDLSIDATRLHAVGVDALIRRGISHLLGNEVHSKTNEGATWYKGFVETNGRTPTAEEIEAQRVVYRQAAIASLYDGTIGTRVGGPRVDPITAEMNVIAKREIMDILKTQGIKKFPTGDNVATLGADKFTGDVLMSRRLAKYGDRIRKEAEKVVAERARKAKAAQAAAAQVQAVDSAEALGL